MNKQEIKEAITNQVINALETNNTLWTKGWTPVMPKNHVTKKPYRGANPIMLMIIAMNKGYASSEWITSKQLKKKGRALKGAKTTTVYYNTPVERKDEQGEVTGKSWLMVAHEVYNIDQTTLKEPKKPLSKLLTDLNKRGKLNSDIENKIKTFPCPIQELQQEKACYVPSLDKIVMPTREQFKSTHHFYGVLLHEMAHSTGHASRLNRTFGKTFGDENYALEELVAEMSSMFLSAFYEINTDEVERNSEAYITSWLKALRSDVNYIFKASSLANNVLDYITTGEIRTYDDKKIVVKEGETVFSSGKSVYTLREGKWYNADNILLDNEKQIAHIQNLIKSGIIKEVKKEAVTA